jgi:hypothetical protein
MKSRDGDVLIDTFRDNGFLEFAWMIQPEKIPSTKRKGHTLIVFLKMIIDLCQNKSCQVTFGEGVILIERFTVRGTDQ